MNCTIAPSYRLNLVRCLLHGVLFHWYFHSRRWLCIYGPYYRKISEPARIRTWNLLIRSQTRYPLRHRSSWKNPSQLLFTLCTCLHSLVKTFLVCYFFNVFAKNSIAGKRPANRISVQSNDHDHFSADKPLPLTIWFSRQKVQNMIFGFRKHIKRSFHTLMTSKKNPSHCLNMML